MNRSDSEALQRHTQTVPALYTDRGICVTRPAESNQSSQGYCKSLGAAAKVWALLRKFGGCCESLGPAAHFSSDLWWGDQCSFSVPGLEGQPL